MLNGTLQYPVYKNARHLTPKEKQNILAKKIAYKSSVFHGYHFIKMNSTYMECVNNSFFLKGNSYFNLLGVLLLGMPIILSLWIFTFYVNLIKYDHDFLSFIFFYFLCFL